jgi:hypothetical protein
MVRARDIAGDRFGRLTAIGRDLSKPGHARWLFHCDCGNDKIVYLQSVVSGRTRSCGCLEAESRRNSNRSHGETCDGRQTPEYMAWNNMRARCSNRRRSDYARYGGRGIRVCERWNGSFDAFLADMGRRPSFRHSIDRIDSNGDYCPENCRWATDVEQSRNRRSSRSVTIDGKSVPLIEACRSAGLPYKSVWYRLKSGWPAEAALKTPIGVSC